MILKTCHSQAATPSIVSAEAPVVGGYAASNAPAARSLHDISIGSRTIGEVEINCSFKHSRYIRGEISQRAQPPSSSAAVYFDISLKQPDAYILKNANVAFTFIPQNSDLYVTEHFGPKALEGESTT